MQLVRETITSPEMIGKTVIGMNGRKLEDVRMDGKITQGHVPVQSVEVLVSLTQTAQQRKRNMRE